MKGSGRHNSPRGHVALEAARIMRRRMRERKRSDIAEAIRLGAPSGPVQEAIEHYQRMEVPCER